MVNEKEDKWLSFINLKSFLSFFIVIYCFLRKYTTLKKREREMFTFIKGEHGDGDKKGP